MTFFDCSDDTVPLYYLGRPGDLQNIRTPNAVYTRTPNSHVVTHELLEGYAVDTSFYEQRVWAIDYTNLTFDEFSSIEEIRTGVRGVGPYVFIDPQTSNWFTANIASGTNVLLDTEGFAASGTGETLSSSNALAYRGTHSLAWSLSPEVTGSGGGVLCMSTSYAPSGWATPESQAWSMTGYIAGGGDDGVVEITPQFVWLDSDGLTVSSTSGTPVTTAAGSWTAISVSGTAPTGVAYVHPRLVITPGSVGASTVVYVDEMMLDMRSTARSWVVGMGQPRVAVILTKETIPVLGRTTASYQLTELSAYVSD